MLDRHAIGVLSLYRGESAAVQAHNLVRLLSCPLAAIHEAVPLAGQIVDFGAGRGLLANYLARRAPGRRIIGIELDQERVALANRCRLDARVEVRAGDAGSPLPPHSAAVLFVDVLYLLDEKQQDELLLRAAQALDAGGILLVKEMATEAAGKMILTRIQEQLAVRWLALTPSTGPLGYRSLEAIAGAMAGAGLSATTRRIDRFSLHPHALVVGRKDLC